MKIRTETLLAILATTFLALTFTPPAFGQNIWVPTGSMNTAQAGPATLLPNGKVLLAGGLGVSGAFLTTAELYDPATGTWTLTGSMNTARVTDTVTLLPNGKVLAAGGWATGFSHPLSSAELYDPATGTWTPTGSMNQERVYFTATLLPNGKVLAVGGQGSTGADAELYDPATGTWTATGSMGTIRVDHVAGLLPNGAVLVAGGYNSGGADNPITSAELYDPGTGAWTPTGSMTSPHDAGGNPNLGAILLPNGKVLVAGGGDGNVQISAADLYDPTTGMWTATGSLNTARYAFAWTLLPNGQVLATGGVDLALYLASAELYDPATGTWTLTSSMNTARVAPATLLPNGKVLVAGGGNASGILSSAELYESLYAAQVQQPINADGTSAFNVRRGVVPVKFTLTLNGVATCQLPSATIAATRTAGGTIGQVNESVYSGAADSGSNFRIDGCQYVYNLNSSALGVGTYRIDIKINGQVVGSAVFQLK
jgi:WD40 repeat protein